MLTKVETVADFQQLPSAIRHIIDNGKGKVSKAIKNTSLQNAVVDAVKDEFISHDLAVEILKRNYAYYKRGKEVLLALNIMKGDTK
jgi:hypothetical protein